MSNIFYVYDHIHPVTGEVVYIGKGCHGRAWDVTRCRGQHKAHQDWMKGLCAKGFTPADWVRILYQGLTEKQALDEEHYLINEGCPVFNRQSGEKQHQAKLTNQQAIEIYELTKSKKPIYHKDIAAKYGVSRTCVSMISSVKQWKAVLIPYIKDKNETRV